MLYGFSSAGGLIFLAVPLVTSLFRVLREYEYGVVFLLGRLWCVKGPGLVLIVPAIQQVMRVDLRMIVMGIPPQDVISHGNVSVKINVAVYLHVVGPERAIIQVADYLEATSQLAQMTLWAILDKHELGEMLAEHEKLNLDIQKVLDIQTNPQGVKITNVEIKHVDLNEPMIRAIAHRAKVKRKRRAKVIHVKGELQASEKLLEAARVLAQ